eukprot:5575485-Amphidinium_carterae.1
MACFISPEEIEKRNDRQASLAEATCQLTPYGSGEALEKGSEKGDGDRTVCGDLQEVRLGAKHEQRHDEQFNNCVPCESANALVRTTEENSALLGVTRSFREQQTMETCACSDLLDHLKNISALPECCNSSQRSSGLKQDKNGALDLEELKRLIRVSTRDVLTSWEHPPPRAGQGDEVGAHHHALRATTVKCSFSKAVARHLHKRL